MVESTLAQDADLERNLMQVRERRLLIDRCDEWLFDEIEPFVGKRVLEVGCGLGNLTRHLVDRDLTIGIDISPESVSEVGRRYADRANVQILVHDITHPSVVDLARHEFDTALSLNVLEHIVDDRLALRHMAQLVGPGGRVIIIVPAHPWLYGSMDRAIGHLRRYSRADLAAKMDAVGLRVEVQKHLNWLGVLGWLINGRLLRQTVPPSGQLKAFNRLVPAVRFIERVGRPPFGLSLLTVARRPAETAVGAGA